MAKQPYPGLRGGPDEVTLNFRFQMNGTSDPDAFVGAGGLISSITRDATGEFSIVFDKNFRYQDVVNCLANCEDNVKEGRYESWDYATGTLVLHTIDNTSGIPNDAADNSWVHVAFTLCRKTTSVGSFSI